MRLLTTLLAALAVCMALLVGAGFWIDAPRQTTQSTGLTAATVLGTTVTAPPAGSSAPGAVARDVLAIKVAAGDEG